MLIGLLIFGLFGALYAFLDSKPEMVAHNNLRVEEPPLQSPRSVVQTLDTDLADSEESLVSTLNDAVLEKEVERGFDQVVQPAVPISSAPLIKEEDDQQIASVDEAVPEVITEAVPEVVTEESVTVQTDAFVADVDESVDQLSTTDVTVIDRSDDFINLNLVETKPIDMVLIEGDDLILDDVNEELSKFEHILPKSVDDAAVESPLAVLSDVVVDTPTEITPKPLVVEIPDVDQALMVGTDQVSREYQNTMSKLLNVKQQIAEADIENERLKVKFSSVVDQNRELAILIRDIDIKIKTLTASN